MDVQTLETMAKVVGTTMAVTPVACYLANKFLYASAPKKALTIGTLAAAIGIAAMSGQSPAQSNTNSTYNHEQPAYTAQMVGK